MKVTFLLLTVVAILTTSICAQERLTEADYNAVLASALNAASARDRRILTEETFYTGSQVTGNRKIVSEFLGPDAKKVEVVEEFNGKRSKSDSIKVGEQFFCRDGEKRWKRADNECLKGGQAMAIPDGKYEYAVETDPNHSGRKIYIRRAAWTDSGLPEREAVRLRSIEIKFTTDENGLILDYTETRRGGIDPNGWSSTQATRYEYEPAGMRITDPTKGS